MGFARTFIKNRSGFASQETFPLRGNTCAQCEKYFSMKDTPSKSFYCGNMLSVVKKKNRREKNKTRIFNKLRQSKIFFWKSSPELLSLLVLFTLLLLLRHCTRAHAVLKTGSESQKKRQEGNQESGLANYFPLPTHPTPSPPTQIIGRPSKKH